MQIFKFTVLVVLSCTLSSTIMAMSTSKGVPKEKAAQNAFNSLIKPPSPSATAAQIDEQAKNLEALGSLMIVHALGHIQMVLLRVAGPNNVQYNNFLKKFDQLAEKFSVPKPEPTIVQQALDWVDGHFYMQSPQSFSAVSALTDKLISDYEDQKKQIPNNEIKDRLNRELSVLNRYYEPIILTLKTIKPQTKLISSLMAIESLYKDILTEKSQKQPVAPAPAKPVSPALAQQAYDSLIKSPSLLASKETKNKKAKDLETLGAILIEQAVYRIESVLKLILKKKSEPLNKFEVLENGMIQVLDQFIPKQIPPNISLAAQWANGSIDKGAETYFMAQAETFGIFEVTDRKKEQLSADKIKDLLNNELEKFDERYKPVVAALRKINKDTRLMNSLTDLAYLYTNALKENSYKLLKKID